MRLTEKKAIDLSIELWEWLAETGERKGDWPGWEKCGVMYASCPICEYDEQQDTGSCDSCPYYRRFGQCQDYSELTPFDKWEKAETPRTRKKYAKLFLKQLYQLRVKK